MEIRGMQMTMTNISDLHTCPVCGVHLIPAVILVTDGQLLEFSSNMIGGTVSMYQFVSTPYELVMADALFCGGPVKDASNLLKQCTTRCPSLPQSWQKTPG
jgi:hypothetical protein